MSPEVVGTAPMVDEVRGRTRAMGRKGAVRYRQFFDFVRAEPPQRMARWRRLRSGRS